MQQSEQQFLNECRQWRKLAERLITAGLEHTNMAGRSLADWRAILMTPPADVLKHRLACIAVAGLAVQFVRETIGMEDLPFVIRFAVLEHLTDEEPAAVEEPLPNDPDPISTHPAAVA